jgi:hypothetical protein
LLKGGWFKGGEDKPKDKAEGADAPGSDPKGQSEGQGGPKPNDARTQSPPDQKMGSYRDVLKTGVDLPNPDHETGGSPNTGKPKIPAPTSVAPLP